MRSGLPLLMVAAMIVAGCRSVSYQTADSVAVEPAVFSSEETALAQALAAFLQGRLLEGMDGTGIEDALPHYMRAAQLARGSHTVHTRIAAGSLHLGDLDRALETFLASYTANPKDPERMIAVATMHQLANRPDEALVLYTQAFASMPTNTTLALTLADLHFGKREDVQALAVLDTAFRQAQEPESIERYLYQRVQRFVVSREPQRAIPALEQMAEWIEEDRAELAYMIAELHIATENPSGAIEAFSRSISLPNAPVAAFLRLGSVLLEQDKIKEAIEVMQAGAQQVPDSFSFPFAIGGLHIQSGDFESAIQAYEIAIEIFERVNQNSTNPVSETQSKKPLLMGLATAQERLKRFDDAATTMKQLLDAYPDSHIAMNFLAYMWAEMNTNLEEAYALSKRSLEIEPLNGAYLDTLGWIYFRMNKLEKALQYLKQARELVGPDPEIILHFGDVYAAKGEMDQAVAYWKESLLADPSDKNRAREQLVNAGIDPQRVLAPLDGDATEKENGTKEEQKDSGISKCDNVPTTDANIVEAEDASPAKPEKEPGINDADSDGESF
jgi:tetratricopeptide (TPR) repeat protein